MSAWAATASATTKVIARRLTSGGGCDVAQLGVGEEAAYDMRQPLQPAQPGDHDRLHLLETPRGGGAPPVALDVVPHPLVGIQLRRVARQPVQPQAPAGGID